MNCKHLKIRSKNYKKYIYCDYLEEKIKFSNCYNCKYKEFKEYKPMKKKSSSLQKLEKERYSIIYKDFSKCCVCGSVNNISINEVFEGSYRKKSMIYGMTNPLCFNCHRRFHDDMEFNKKIKRQFQREFEKTHTRDEFISIFMKNYINN